LRKGDLASHTSSASSKLIHGGLRYLEHYEFRLVREALAEREVLLAKAPHIVKQMRFVLPHRPHLAPGRWSDPSPACSSMTTWASARNSPAPRASSSALTAR